MVKIVLSEFTPLYWPGPAALLISNFANSWINQLFDLTTDKQLQYNK